MKCICPDPYCPEHAQDRWGHKLIIDGDDEPAFCPECGHDVLPVGVCKTDKPIASPDGPQTGIKR